MIKSLVLNKNAHRRCLSYFSNAFNNLANQGAPKMPAQMQNTGLNNLDLDIFVNQDHKQMDLLDKLVKLRKQKECSAVPLLPNILVQQLMEHATPQEAITVLRSPLQYGIFIDQFTGCHLIDFLLNNGHAREAAQVSALLIERELCNNELVAALAVQSFYAYLKNYEAKVAEKVEETPEVEKVRVKFLRNNNEEAAVKTEEQILGEAIIKLAASPNSLKELGQNITLIGFVLCARLAEAEKYLSQNQQIFFKDILQVSRKLMDNDVLKGTPEFINLLDQAIEECAQTSSFDGILESRVKLAATSLEPQLIAEYSKGYQEWLTGFQRAVQDQNKIHDVQNRVESIQNTLSGLQTMRQNLWFFENKEDIDIEIFKKKVYYPKRWFGKKKKPKAVDAFYVPPTISRAH